ncbi:MAG: MutS-related protein [Luteimonas sp.]
MTIFELLKDGGRALLDALFPRRQALARLRAKWGQPGDKALSGISRYFDLTREASAGDVVDDQTWTDLEFPRLFADLDTTESPLGSQYLYRQLRFYAEPAPAAAHYASCQTLRADATLRERLQLALAGLDTASNWQLARFIFGAPPEVDPLHRLLPWWSLVCVVVLVLVAATPLPIWALLLTVGINLLLILWLSTPLFRDIELLKGCSQLLRIADSLARVRSDASALPQLARLRAEARLRRKVRASLGWIAFLYSPWVQSVAIWLNLLCLLELAAYGRTVARFGRVRAELAATFESVGAVDAAIAVASFLEQRPQHCEPVISKGSRLDLVDGTHPLTMRPVANSIRLDGRSALITGSNMAGKTTFIKLVGINLILGRTLGFCFASRATLPHTRVMAVIRGEHSVESGKSHYFAEMTAIQTFIEHADRGTCRLFLIDELFNGTNTVERLAAGRAVLERLGRNAQVLVTTHDVELQDDVTGPYDLYYFQEDPDVDGWFDYRLRPGRTDRRNAIQLLARNGFPADLVADALGYADVYASLAGVPGGVPARPPRTQPPGLTDA